MVIITVYIGAREQSAQSVGATPACDSDTTQAAIPAPSTLASDICRRSREVTIYYDRNELPTGLEIAKARQFELGSMKSVLLHEEVRIA